MSEGWYYVDGGEQRGPVPESELERLIREGRLGPGTMVWSRGMTDWQPMESVDALRSLVPGPPAQAPAETDPGGIYRPPQAPTRVASAASAAIPSYLWQSIACTLLCCLPAGVVAIIYAARVDSLARAGQLDEARQASANARTWCWVSFGVGLGVSLIYLVAMIGSEM